jgi:predicted LPLAT superfamily acyltransferase
MTIFKHEIDKLNILQFTSSISWMFFLGLSMIFEGFSPYCLASILLVMFIYGLYVMHRDEETMRET